MKKIMTVLFTGLLVFFVFSSCKESSDEGAPAVTVPAANTLNTYTGTLPTNDSAGQAKAVAVLAGVVAGVDAQFAKLPVRKGGETSKSVDRDYYNTTINKTFSGGSGTGNVKVHVKSNFLYWSDASEVFYYYSGTPPNPGSYVTVTSDLNVTTTLNTYTKTVYYNGANTTYTVSGKVLATVDGSYNMTFTTYPAASVSYSLGIGYGFAVSVSSPSGMGGKFVVSVSFQNSGKDTVTDYRYDDPSFTIGEKPANFTVQLQVYDNSNTLKATYTLTEAQYMTLVPANIISFVSDIGL